jgi:UDP-GlcNAc:undecaprenyl-phosphate/decaprenyl-phosphate GlcNAc-1-phosphate transferase
VNVGEALGVAAGAFAVTFVATPLCARVAAAVGLVDRPGPLKPQARPTPYLGGIGLAGGVALGSALYRPWLLVPLAMALCLGTMDDARPLPPMVRLAGELATGVVLASLISTRFSNALSYVLVTLAAVVLMNGLNLIDGLDALCGGVTLLSAVGFAVILTGEARYLAVGLAGATLAFLVYNRPPARIYLGDGGAYLIGAGLTALLALAWGPGQRVHTGVAALVLVALPVAELAFAVLRRARARRSLLQGDRSHPYDQLVRRGWSREQAVWSYDLAGLVLLGVAVLVSVVNSLVAAIVAGIAGACLLAIGVQAGFMAPNSHESTDDLPR